MFEGVQVFQRVIFHHTSDTTESTQQKSSLDSISDLQYLGKGGFGSVVLGEWKGRRVAVKVKMGFGNREVIKMGRKSYKYFIIYRQGVVAGRHARRGARRGGQPRGPGAAADGLGGERAERAGPPPRERRPRLRRIQLSRGRAGDRFSSIHF